MLFSAATLSFAVASDLPIRESPIPETTDGVPHIQIGIEPVPEISRALLEHVATFPGVILGNTRLSLPGAVGFQLKDDMELKRPDMIIGGREFAHLHPDGSLHASLAPDVAREAIATGWAVSHPRANDGPKWVGFVMIFTPTTQDELVVVNSLIESSYTFVTGQKLRH
jgi:phospholipase/carboxylesterase